MRILQHTADAVLQRSQLGLKLLHTVIIELQRNIRAHLTDDTAYILAALNSAIAAAAADQTILTANDTTHIIADMRISHRTVIHTITNLTGRISHNTASIGYIRAILTAAGICFPSICLFLQIADLILQVCIFL